MALQTFMGDPVQLKGRDNHPVSPLYGEIDKGPFIGPVLMRWDCRGRSARKTDFEGDLPDDLVEAPE